MMAEPTYPDLKGRTALVTGGADGIGRAAVAALARQGMRVGFIDIAADAGRTLEAELRATGADVAFAHADLRDLKTTLSAVDSLQAQLGPVAILVNNAGHDERHAFASVTPDYWDDRLAVNLRPMMFLAQKLAPGMAALGGGAIVNLSSTSWMKRSVDLIAYTTAKSAVIGLTRSLARELGGDRIRVNCVTPGWVMTPRQRAERLTPERWAQAQEQQAIKGAIEPEDIAAMILFLASDASRMCTGQNFIVDAGTV
jgi:NAD(P)-dependent dehydrogenase (short-subunit alcohol dehydrogenase family)